MRSTSGFFFLDKVLLWQLPERPRRTILYPYVKFLTKGTMPDPWIWLRGLIDCSSGSLLLFQSIGLGMGHFP